MRLIDFCEGLEEMNRKLVVERGLDVRHDPHSAGCGRAALTLIPYRLPRRRASGSPPACP